MPGDTDKPAPPLAPEKVDQINAAKPGDAYAQAAAEANGAGTSGDPAVAQQQRQAATQQLVDSGALPNISAGYLETNLNGAKNSDAQWGAITADQRHPGNAVDAAAAGYLKQNWDELSAAAGEGPDGKGLPVTEKTVQDLPKFRQDMRNQQMDVTHWTTTPEDANPADPNYHNKTLLARVDQWSGTRKDGEGADISKHDIEDALKNPDAKFSDDEKKFLQGQVDGWDNNQLRSKNDKGEVQDHINEGSLVNATNYHGLESAKDYNDLVNQNHQGVHTADNGQITGVVNADGSKQNFAYNPDGSLSGITEYKRGEDGNVSSTQFGMSPDGKWGTRDEMTGVVTPNGQMNVAVAHPMDAKGQPVKDEANITWSQSNPVPEGQPPHYTTVVQDRRGNRTSTDTPLPPPPENQQK